MLFERQIVTEEFMSQEAWPLFDRHFREISANQDIPLSPAVDKYVAMENAGSLRAYVIRIDSVLVGYAFYFVNYNLHYSSSKQAVQDILFLEKRLRGQGAGKIFIEWCDNQLRSEGVQVVYHHVKTYLNFGPLLETLGYKHIENVYSRRLDGGFSRGS